MKWRLIREVDDVSNGLHKLASKLRAVAGNTMGDYALFVMGLTAFTMAQLCSQMKAVRKPAIKPIVSPVKKTIILFSSSSYILVGLYVLQKSCKINQL